MQLFSQLLSIAKRYFTTGNYFEDLKFVIVTSHSTELVCYSVASGDFNYAMGTFIFNYGVRCKVCVLSCHLSPVNRNDTHPPHIYFLGFLGIPFVLNSFLMVAWLIYPAETAVACLLRRKRVTIFGNVWCSDRALLCYLTRNFDAV